MSTPEAIARIAIDRLLTEAGWAVQDARHLNLYAASGVAVREVSLKPGHGEADYLLFVDGEAIGAVEAKKEGASLTGVEVQSARYGAGLPDHYQAPVRPLPFLYESTGVETRFTNRLDPEPRSRPVFGFHRPETLAAWAYGRALGTTSGLLAAEGGVPYDARHTLRARLQELPPLDERGLWPAQATAVTSLERSLAADNPRSLIQMATGSGKTFTAITAIYRLIRYGGARRVVFLVDRANLGRQTMAEFEKYRPPDDGRTFTELYVVQHLRSNRIDPAARVVITTIQRLYSILRGDDELDEALEEESLFERDTSPFREPVPVAYNPQVPIETFDVIFTDECHRSIYHLWRQVLDYFDAFLVGLTATPSKQTFGFFNQNLVMEYGHEQAVADGVNVDYDVYAIKTAITQAGSTVEANFWVDTRDRQTRAKRIRQLDEDLVYAPNQLDRDVVAPDQIRTVIRTFKERLFTEIFPGRSVVPKTLVFAKDDSHADDIVEIVRQVFAKGNDFCRKITYRTTGAKPEDLINDFRTSYDPRIVVTVDMIATGTDIKPVEIVMFMRMVRSPAFFEQMKGRGVRVIDEASFQDVAPDATAKTRFVLVDCVGVTETVMTERTQLDTKKSVPVKALLQSLAFNTNDPEVYASLASRLARLEKQLDADTKAELAELAGGLSLNQIAGGLVSALDPDRQAGLARAEAGLSPEAEPEPAQVAAARKRLMREAAAPLAANPELREAILRAGQQLEQTIDTVSKDALLAAGYDTGARERARARVASWETFIREHAAELTALQILHNQPHGARMRFKDVKELARAIAQPPLGLTTDELWEAYRALEASRVRGSGTRMLTDLVSLVRFALAQEPELAPYRERVEARYAAWLTAQAARGATFTAEQLRWLEAIKEHIATSVEVSRDDFDEAPFNAHGGLGRIYALFGDALDPLLDELNEALAA